MPAPLYSRSFITTADRVIKVVVAESSSHEAMVTVDGQNGYEVRGGDVIITKKSRSFCRCLSYNLNCSLYSFRNLYLGLD